MSAELVQLLRDWSFGIFMFSMGLLLTIESCFRVLAKHNKCRCDDDDTDVDDDPPASPD